MIDILSQIQLQWVLGLFFAMFLFNLRKSLKNELFERKISQQRTEKIMGSITELEKSAKIMALENQNLKEKTASLKENCQTLKEELSKQTYAIEVKLYKVRGEQNAILEKLDSKIENIYQLLTKKDV